MPRFITIGYGDRADYDRTPVGQGTPLMLRCETAVRRRGDRDAGAPVQIRNPEARGMESRDGPFMSSTLPIAGVAIIEAADLAQAIEKVSLAPCAVTHGVVEVWPLEETPRI